MLLNVVCFLSLCVCVGVLSVWCIGSTLVSSCRCCVLVSCVHPVAIISAVFLYYL